MSTAFVRPSAFRTLFHGALVATALSTAACADDPGPGKLFDEDGAWELQSFALEGSGLEQVASARGGELLMRFDNENRVVQTAMCANNERATPSNTECEGVNDSQWFCHCFAYDFVEDEMAWLEFEAGATVPVVKVGDAAQADAGGADESGDTDTDTDGSGEEGGDEGGADAGGGDEAPADGIHMLTVAEISGAAATIDFTPLPAEVFGSNGTTSKYTFVKKAGSVYDVVLEDPERPSCEPCI
ncbi:MAG: hypothetical protein ACE37F_35255 [Nannocystaceae bacterium]|nr:hypothetical protein [bacterium]